MNVLSFGLLAAAAIIGAKPDDPAAKELKLHLELITGEEVRFGKSAGPGERAYVFEPSCLDGNPEACAWEWTATNCVFRGKTYFAVIDFLENGLGVRWPGGTDVSYVPMKEIVPRMTSGRWAPTVRVRSVRSARADTDREKNENHVFSKRMRHGRHDVPFYRHAFPTWWGKYGKDRKDYFAMRKDGLRGPINAKPAELDGDVAVYAANTGTSLGMCVTSTGLLAQVIANWQKEGSPKWVNVCENDVPGTGSCHCPACTALDVVPTDIDPLHEYHHGDRYVWFGNRVLEAARKIRPDAEVCYYAYNASRDAPKRERPLPGSLIGLVPTDFRPGAVAAYLDSWKAAGMKDFFYRPNRHWCYASEFIPTGWEESFFNEMKCVLSAGSIGFDYDAICAEPLGFGWFERYLLYHGLQDPSKDFAYWEDHYCSAYGAAAGDVKAYLRYWRREKWERTLLPNLECLLRRGRFSNFGRGLVWDLGRYYCEADFAAAEKFVAAAEAKTLPAPQAALVRKLRLRHEHTKLFFRAVTARSAANAQALLDFRRANGLNDQPWFEKYYGDVTGIAALQKGKEIGPDASANVIRTFDVRKYGARTDATPRENAAAIQRAIDAAAEHGNGRVRVPSGTWPCGTIWMKSGVELHLDEGAVVKASGDLADYNDLDAYPENGSSKGEEWVGKHLVIARGAERFAITGPGTLDGSGDSFFEARPRKINPKAIAWLKGMRKARDPQTGRAGQLVVAVRCRDVFFGDGLKVRNAPCWCLFCLACTNVTVSGYSVRNGPTDGNTDGVDIDCCRNVLVENCDIETGDDGVAIRGAAHRLGVADEKDVPCENVVVRNSRLRSEAMGVRIGVGAGAIRNVRLENLDIVHSGVGVSFETTYGTGENAGVDISDVRVDKVRIGDCAYNWRFNVGGDRLRKGVRDILFADCEFGARFRGYVAGDRTKVSNVKCRDCRYQPVANSSFTHLGPEDERK